jgi:putative hydroxymethylpyrimidine transport system substrate-binding protein
MKKVLLLLLLLSASVAHAADKITLVLDWFPNPDHAPLFVAEQQGFFKQQNLIVELLPPADPSDPAKLVAAGKADMAIGYEPQLLEQIDQGLPLQEVGKLINKPLATLAVLQSSPISSLSDLKHRRIGYASNGTNSVMLKVMLEKQGSTINDVELVQIHYNLTQALLSGKVDAVTGMNRNFEMAQLQMTGHPGRAFYPEENGIPSYSELIFIANSQHLNKNVIERFLKAVKQGAVYLQAHPNESWEAFAKAHPEANDKLNRHAWFATLPLFDRDPAMLDTQQFMRFAQFMQKNGLIKTVKPFSTYFGA